MHSLSQRRLVALLLLSTAATMEAQSKPLLTPTDYGKWESLGFGAQLAPNGKWVAYQLNRVDEENELRLQSTAVDTAAVRAGGGQPTIRIRYGASMAFSGDSRWAAYLIGASPAEREKAADAKRPFQNRLGLVELATGSTVTIDRIASFQFSADGRYLALRAYPPQRKETAAVDLAVRDLAAGTMMSFGNVTEFAWSDRGAAIALAIESETASGNGIQLYDAATGTQRVLESGASRYRALAWRKDADDLAALRSAVTPGWRDTTHALLAWTGVLKPSTWKHILAPDATGIGADRRITERRTPVWSEDGAMVAFGLRARVPSPDTTAKRDSATVSDVQVWHAQDSRVIPMQKAQEKADLGRSLLATWRIASGRVVVAGTDPLEQAQVLHGWRTATETHEHPYKTDNMFGRDRADVALIDLETGVRTAAVDSVRYFFGGSATGKYLCYFRRGQYWTVDVATGVHTNVTAKLPTVFADTAYDTPTPDFPPFTGFGGVRWSTDDRFVYLNDQYDVWRVAPDGSGGTRLTDGARDRIVSRIQVFDRSARGLDPADPLYFTLTGERTKQTGFAWLPPKGRFERIVLRDARLGRLVKADSVPTFLYQEERFDDSPDLMIAGAGLIAPHQLSQTNSFQADYGWGRAELVDYTTVVGRALQGALFFPAGYQPGTTYPMIVNPYEIRATELHAYSVPSERSYYNVQAWTQHGYFVLLPDIVFRWREPGPSTVEALEAAVAAVVAKGNVDAKRVGLVGHSWGGYEAAYVPTRSHIFAAAVAGAPLTDFISMMGAVHWTPGLPETQHWETGQARMEVPFWEDFDAHIRSSPVAKIHELRTPMLMEFGDADGTVDFRQGVEFYNFARRAGNKEFVLLVYPGEDHGLRKKENQIDYHRRILQWFGHYLKGEPAPSWMTEGVTWLDRKRTLDDAAPKPKTAAPSIPDHARVTVPE